MDSDSPYYCNFYNRSVGEQMTKAFVATLIVVLMMLILLGDGNG